MLIAAGTTTDVTVPCTSIMMMSELNTASQ